MIQSLSLMVKRLAVIGILLGVVGGIGYGLHFVVSNLVLVLSMTLLISPIAFLFFVLYKYTRVRINN